jgi:hypothetical protein
MNIGRFEATCFLSSLPPCRHFIRFWNQSHRRQLRRRSLPPPLGPSTHRPSPGLSSQCRLATTQLPWATARPPPRPSSPLHPGPIDAFKSPPSRRLQTIVRHLHAVAQHLQAAAQHNARCLARPSSALEPPPDAAPGRHPSSATCRSPRFKKCNFFERDEKLNDLNELNEWLWTNVWMQVNFNAC